MFKLPFPVWLANTPVTLETQVRGEDGITKVMLFSGKAIVEERTQVFMNKERQQVKMSGKVIIQGDILPGEDIKGYLTFNGQERTIVSTVRPRNPDGSVFSTEVGFE
ncbi:hypothetical protein DSECCO2_551680 [anaerobic digester metagenome]